MPIDEKKFTRAPQAGLRLGVPTNGVYRLLQLGRLRGVCEEGRWWIENSSIDAYLSNRESAPTRSQPHPALAAAR